MTFQPMVPIGGYAGWRFLSQTIVTQRENFDAAPTRDRDTTYFRENIADVKTPQDLVSDRRLLSVALGAFGLDDDLDNRAFIERILGDGYSDRTALANRMADKRYVAFAEAFGFGEGLPPRTSRTGFADEILSAYAERQFEISIGNVNENMRLALSAKRELTDLAGSDISDEAKWFTVMGNAPLRAVMEKALGLPNAIGSVDIDKQREFFEDAASRVFGISDLTELADPEMQEDVIRRFLVRAQLEEGPTGLTPGATALALLSGSV